MNPSDSPGPVPSPEPPVDGRTKTESDRQSNRRVGVIGALIATFALVASVFALSAVAGARGPELVAENQEPVQEVDESDDDDAGMLDDVPDELRAAEECWLDLEARYGLDELEDSDVDGAELDETAWEAFEAEEEACKSLLPPDVQNQLAAEEEAWADFDACIDGVIEKYGDEIEMLEADELKLGNGVSVMSGDELSFAEFGEGDGSITVTQIDGEVTVTTDGDVTIAQFDGELFDDPAFDEIDGEFEACDSKLPADLELLDLDDDAEFD